jgi:hypothetical protein
VGLLPITTSSKPERLREYLEVWADKEGNGSLGLTLTDQEVGAGQAGGAEEGGAGDTNALARKASFGTGHVYCISPGVA